MPKCLKSFKKIFSARFWQAVGTPSPPPNPVLYSRHQNQGIFGQNERQSTSQESPPNICM
jgi:hypothetical protein